MSLKVPRGFAMIERVRSSEQPPRTSKQHAPEKEAAANGVGHSMNGGSKKGRECMTIARQVLHTKLQSSNTPNSY